MKILINTPLINIPAGVSNHYLGLKFYFSKNVIYNQYIPSHIYAKKLKIKPLVLLLRLFTFLFDILKFVFLIFAYRKPHIVLNPSFVKSALKRDLLYLKIAKFLGCRVAVFIHGWDRTYFECISAGDIKFSEAWKTADAFLVLADEFKRDLETLGIDCPIHKTTTKVNDKLLEGISSRKSFSKIQNILFLARVEEAKGVFTSIDTLGILLKKHPDIQLSVVGQGNALKRAQEYVEDKGLRNITFTGALSGDALVREFIQADIYILPTVHGEGMPTTVLEAMAFGLPVITRPVGGIVDFFEDDKMGYLIESVNPEDYAEKIEILTENPEKAARISEYNQQYAKENFMATKVARKLESVFNSM
jgi:glycosyltransferase involved in cell wall biosynthesis